MKKSWMIAGAVTLAVTGALPWVVGYVTEIQWQQATEEMNRAQPFLQMETADYRRGVLGSDVEGVLVFSNPETGESHRWHYHARVSHGVVGSLLSFEPEGGWSPAGTDWFPEAEPKLTLETRLWGKATLELEAPLMTISDASTGESLTTSGGLARLELAGAGARSRALMVWPSVSLSGPELDIRLADLHMEQDMEHLAGDVWTGQMDFSVGSVEMAQPGLPATRLQGLRMNTQAEAQHNDTRLSSSVALNVDEVIQGDQSYGPHQLGLSLNNLDIASWNAFLDAFSSMQALHADGSLAAQEQGHAVMDQVSSSLRDVAAAGFSLAMPELMVTTPEGEITGHAEIRHPELSGEQKAGMLLVMQQLTGDFGLSLPRALIDNYPDLRLQMAPLIKEGLLVSEGDRLVMNGKMEDLVLDVNGTEFPLPPLL
ncbi:DUF945 family protein [Marinobacter sp. F4216]|uniref:DUF945 family protein n=1 Tax=Marinobacter sp. F4216 TaxID=2874281 RepID=UPI001CBCEBD3|nr:DUF945 family protein [Marinobacter sp. F4216]MBZ2169243.1 YdgA family protein [Marinobacter sp. F4216]